MHQIFVGVSDGERAHPLCWQPAPWWSRSWGWDPRCDMCSKKSETRVRRVLEACDSRKLFLVCQKNGECRGRLQIQQEWFWIKVRDQFPDPEVRVIMDRGLHYWSTGMVGEGLSTVQAQPTQYRCLDWSPARGNLEWTLTASLWQRPPSLPVLVQDGNSSDWKSRFKE